MRIDSRLRRAVQFRCRRRSTTNFTRPRTRGSNPVPSCAESANHRFLSVNATHDGSGGTARPSALAALSGNHSLARSDCVNDDQPYLFEIGSPPLVSLPYSVQTNDVLARCCIDFPMMPMHRGSGHFGFPFTCARLPCLSQVTQGCQLWKQQLCLHNFRFQVGAQKQDRTTTRGRV